MRILCLALLCFSLYTTNVSPADWATPLPIDAIAKPIDSESTLGRHLRAHQGMRLKKAGFRSIAGVNQALALAQQRIAQNHNYVLRGYYCPKGGAPVFEFLVPLCASADAQPTGFLVIQNGHIRTVLNIKDATDIVASGNIISVMSGATHREQIKFKRILTESWEAFNTPTPTVIAAAGAGAAEKGAWVARDNEF